MLRTLIEHRLRAAWQRRGPLAWALWPLARLYGVLMRQQRARAIPVRLPVPVIVIGNVVAGGTGKTPATLAIVRHLQTRGWQPGIISRGHGRQGSGCREVLPGDAPGTVGDEPLLLCQRSGVPVYVASHRADAGRALLAAHPNVDVLVCDDGLQHHSLARDVQICVFDARGTGNGWLLPAGPLREPWPRSVDLVLRTETGAPLPPTLTPAGTCAPVFAATRQLASNALRADGSAVPLNNLRGQPLTAVAGIARPEAFFDMLRARGLALAHTIALPDHFRFDRWRLPPSVPSVPSIRSVRPAATQNRAGDAHDVVDAGQPLLCTEKDAAKLWPLAPHALAVPLRLEIPATFFAALDECLATQGYHARVQHHPGSMPHPHPHT